MKNKFKIQFINIFLIIIFIYIFLYSKNIKKYILYAITLWINNLIPSILPFLLISKLLIYYGMINYLSKIFGKYINRFFNVSKVSSFAVITSIFTGFPTGALYTKELLNNQDINQDEANHLITFTNFSNPLFIISGIGENLLKNKKIGIFIFISHLITGLLTGFLLKSKKKTNNNYHYIRKKNDKQFITVLNNSIYDSFKILLNILGIMIFFLMIISLIDTILPNNLFTLVIKGLLEMTSGISFISNNNISMRLKVAIISFLISFSGLSIHFQTKSIIDNTNIRYSKYLVGRIVHSLLCFCFSFSFYSLFFNL